MSHEVCQLLVHVHPYSARIEAYQVADIIQNLEFAICASAFGMHDSFRYPFSIEVRQQIDEVKILEEKRAILTHSLGGLGIVAATLTLALALEGG